MTLIKQDLTREVPKQGHALRNVASAIAALLFLSGSVLAWGLVQQPSRLGPYGALTIRNYGVVWPGKVVRSGKPYTDAGWQWLHEQGVKSVVTFLKDDNVDYRKFGFGSVLRIPLHGEQVPTAEQTEQFLQFIQDPNDWPADVHCSEGKDRTGMMIALARYAVDGWPMGDALAEAKRYRGGSDLAPFRVEWLRKWAANHSPGSERRPSP